MVGVDAWKKKRTVMKRYDQTANLYDMRYAEEQSAKIEAAMKSVEIRKNSYVLDAGCGTGIMFERVAGMARLVVGIDVSRKTLLLAKNTAKNFENIHLVCGDVDNLPFEDEIYAHVFAFTVIQNMPKPVETLEEIERVAEADARIIVTGLKRIFTRRSFEKLLTDSGLNILSMIDGDLKCYIAVCEKTHS